jgi:hypothetical protein
MVGVQLLREDIAKIFTASILANLQPFFPTRQYNQLEFAATSFKLPRNYQRDALALH